jgi:hypothetical protein|tara:strand:- start:444 stop:656 length:213 start_codon:yes stop_codon:yes gene_type:complete
MVWDTSPPLAFYLVANLSPIAETVCLPNWLPCLAPHEIPTGIIKNPNWGSEIATAKVKIAPAKKIAAANI